MVAPLIGGVIQIIFQDVPVLSVGIVISFLLAYINIIESLIFLNPLTGISNRKKLLQRLLYRLQNIKPDEKLYFLFIDVDKFKRINDSYGHVEGDRVLTDIALLLTRHTTGTDSCVGRYGGDEFAEHLQNTFRFCGSVGRIGGDEFAVIFTLKKTMSDDICARFIECLHDNDITAGGEHKVTLSIGCTECTQSDSIKDIIARADKEMHEIKKHKAVDHCIS